MQGEREKVGETEGMRGRHEAMKERRREREGVSGGGMKVNVTNAGEERGVFDLTNRDSKTLAGPVAGSELSLYCTL